MTIARDKIGWFVVGPVPVNVVDLCCAAKKFPHRPFHDEHMFSDIPMIGAWMVRSKHDNISVAHIPSAPPVPMVLFGWTVLTIHDDLCRSTGLTPASGPIPCGRTMLGHLPSKRDAATQGVGPKPRHQSTCEVLANRRPTTPLSLSDKISTFASRV